MLGIAVAERTTNNQLLPTCPPRHWTENEGIESGILLLKTIGWRKADISDRPARDRGWALMEREPRLPIPRAPLAARGYLSASTLSASIAVYRL
jgi:hypothetical protein